MKIITNLIQRLKTRKLVTNIEVYRTNSDVFFVESK